MFILRTAPHRIAIAALLALTAFSPTATSARTVAAPTQAAEERTASERVSADTPHGTPGGATFTVPAGWSIMTGKNMVIPEPPETDTHIAIVDAQAADAAAAVNTAWG